jgi:hypothetical protein
MDARRQEAADMSKALSMDLRVRVLARFRKVFCIGLRPKCFKVWEQNTG